MLTIVALATTSAAQIKIPLDTTLAVVNSEWMYVAHVDLLQQQIEVPLEQDSVIFTYSEFPNDLIEYKLSKQGDYWENDTCYTYTNRSLVRQTYAGRLIVYQMVLKKVYKATEKNIDKRLRYLTRYAKDNGYNNLELYNLLLLDSIIVQ